MSILPPCSKCKSEYTYEDGDFYICPECAHEWPIKVINESVTEELIVKDSHGNRLNEGDFVSVIKDLKIKGSSATIKVGTKIKILRLVDGDHNIDCKVDGTGAMGLKSEFVKKLS